MQKPFRSCLEIQALTESTIVNEKALPARTAGHTSTKIKNCPACQVPLDRHLRVKPQCIPHALLSPNLLDLATQNVAKASLAYPIKLTFPSLRRKAPEVAAGSCPSCGWVCGAWTPRKKWEKYPILPFHSYMHILVFKTASRFTAHSVIPRTA